MKWPFFDRNPTDTTDNKFHMCEISKRVREREGERDSAEKRVKNGKGREKT